MFTGQWILRRYRRRLASRLQGVGRYNQVNSNLDAISSVRRTYAVGARGTASRVDLAPWAQMILEHGVVHIDWRPYGQSADVSSKIAFAPGAELVFRVNPKAGLRIRAEAVLSEEARPWRKAAGLLLRFGK